jgi:hypothetical protein
MNLQSENMMSKANTSQRHQRGILVAMVLSQIGLIYGFRLFKEVIAHRGIG